MKKSLVSFFETFAAGVFLSILIMIFVGQSLEITGDSMLYTLRDGERIIVEKVTYKSGAPKRNDIIIFRSFQNNQVFLIKRVIAIPGDTLQLSPNGTVNVYSSLGTLETNGSAQDIGTLEEYSTTPIPEGYIAVMGDNRDESYDSRIFGLVPLEKVVGKAFLVYWPPAGIRAINI